MAAPAFDKDALRACTPKELIDERMVTPIRLATTACVLALAACATHHPAPSPSPSPSAAASPVALATALPVALATASPSATPLPTAKPTPLPAVRTAIEAKLLPVQTASPSTPVPVATTLVATAIFVKPDAAPRIIGVKMSSNSVQSGDKVSGVVTTTSNVASVEARIGSLSIGVPKTGIGTFALTYHVPPIPFFLHGTYSMKVIARNARGDQTIREIPITVH